MTNSAKLKGRYGDTLRQRVYAAYYGRNWTIALIRDLKGAASVFSCPYVKDYLTAAVANFREFLFESHDSLVGGFNSNSSKFELRGADFFDMADPFYR